jgi:hypothetical protein
MLQLLPIHRYDVESYNVLFNDDDAVSNNGVFERSMDVTTGPFIWSSPKNFEGSNCMVLPVLLSRASVTVVADELRHSTSFQSNISPSVPIVVKCVPSGE